MADVEPFPLEFKRSQKRLPFRRESVGTEQRGASPDDRSRVSVSSIRLHCQLLVFPTAGDVQYCDCIIDTGAPVSVFPRKIWASWPPGTIEWLEPSDEYARRLTGVKGISGDKATARLGCVTVSLWNLHPSRLTLVVETKPFEIIAKFISADSGCDRVAFGMVGNAMERWQRLEVDFATDTAQLV